MFVLVSEDDGEILEVGKKLEDIRPEGVSDEEWEELQEEWVFKTPEEWTEGDVLTIPTEKLVGIVYIYELFDKIR